MAAPKRVEVGCPFYKRSNSVVIRCEGIAWDGYTDLGFRTMREKDKQMRIFCCKHYRNCEVYRAIVAAKYEE